MTIKRACAMQSPITHGFLSPIKHKSTELDTTAIIVESDIYFVVKRSTTSSAVASSPARQSTNQIIDI